MPTFVFLDTNIFLHYQDFDQIKWSNVLGSDPITIVIPPVTIRELNKQKDSNQYTKKIRSRAGKMLIKLDGFFVTESQSKLREGLEILLEDRDPLINFAENHLSLEVNDDHLIASILTLRQENPDASFVLVTSDSGLTLTAKARRHDIKVVRLSNTLKLKEEPDPDQEKIKELTQELDKVKRTIPNLSLVFKNNSQHAIFTLDTPVELTEREIEERVDELKRKYPKMDEKPKESTDNKGDPFKELSDVMAPLMLASLYAVSPEDITKYNSELDKFFQLYPEELNRQIGFKNQNRRTIRLDIFLANNGTAPGNDIDIFMHFPDGFRLVDELPSGPNELLPPNKPKTQIEKMRIINPPLLSEMFGLSSDHLANINQAPSNVSSPNIKRTNSYEVNVHVANIKHGLVEQLDPLFIIFDAYETASPFQIEYSILAANVPQKIKGNLHVVIKK